MAFTYTTILIEDIGNGNSVIVRGYETVGSGGVVLNIAIERAETVGGRRSEFEVDEVNFFIAGESVASILAALPGPAPFTELLRLSLSDNSGTRIIRAVEIGAAGAIFHSFTEIQFGSSEVFVAAQIGYWIQGATVDEIAKDIVGGTGG
ncbi:MAG: hypothetical protein ACYTBJ_20280, partial [Planctomycetota bacterium]